eukprot:2294489-Karenia_brevis.AAC.1
MSVLPYICRRRRGPCRVNLAKLDIDCVHPTFACPSAAPDLARAEVDAVGQKHLCPSNLLARLHPSSCCVSQLGGVAILAHR